MKYIILSLVFGLLIALGSEYLKIDILKLSTAQYKDPTPRGGKPSNSQPTQPTEPTTSPPPVEIPATTQTAAGRVAVDDFNWVNWEGEESLELCRNMRKDLKNVWAPEDSYVFVQVLLDHCGWKYVTDHTNATLAWTTGHSDMPTSVKTSLKYGKGQIWSQLPDSWIICDKGRLHNVLKTAGRLDFQPETYYLTDAEECRDFFKSAALHPDYIWVTKEVTSSQGDGITVNPDVQKLKEEWLVDPKAPVENYECREDRQNLVAQRYITNPLLLEGKKMEIRTYWVIVSVDPLIVIYRDGTVRLTTRNYTNDNWNDPLIHITNTKQQKKADPNYHQTVAERKWTFDQLADYLKNNAIIENTEVWKNNLRSLLEERIRVTVQAALPQFLALKTSRGWDGRYELMGMDVILDDKLHPWLTEMQDGPGLSLDPGIKQHVVPNLIRELVDVVLEVDLTLRSGHILPFPLRSLGEWRQIDMRIKSKV